MVAIREVATRAGRQIDVIGHSQGGLQPRWALKWWPSLRPLVDDYVAMSSTEHGSLDAAAVCTGGTCAPAVWQQRPGSAFLNALNAGDETPGNVSYTSIYSLTDEIVPELPPPPTSAMAGASNIAVQDVCPGRPVNHVGALHDAVEFALVIDALDHPGPADAKRIPATTCLALTAPGLDATDVAYIQSIALGLAGYTTIVAGPKSSAEPPLAPYATAAANAPDVAAAPSPQAPSPSPNAAPSPQPSPAPSQTPNTPQTLAATGGGDLASVGLVLVAAALVTRRLRSGGVIHSSS